MITSEKNPESIKTRVPKGTKQAFMELAARRYLKAADLQREAFRKYLNRALKRKSSKLNEN